MDSKSSGSIEMHLSLCKSNYLSYSILVFSSLPVKRLGNHQMYVIIKVWKLLKKNIAKLLFKENPLPLCMFSFNEVVGNLYELFIISST